MADRERDPLDTENTEQAPYADGFESFVIARQHRLLRSAFLVVGDLELARDLLQEALIKLALNWSKIHTDPESYVRTVLYRDAVSWWRRRREYASARVPEGAVRDSAHESTARMAFAKVLTQLSPKQRAVLVLRYFDDLPVEAAADVLGVSVGTVKSQTHVALRRLRELIPETGDLADLRGD